MLDTRKLLLQGILFLALLPTPTLATETGGSLQSGYSDSFRKLNYTSFVFEPEPGTSFQIVMKSRTIDSYLMAVEPNGKILTNDDHNLPKVAKLSPGDAAIVVNHPAQGRWILVATTFKPGEEGEYSIEYTGIPRLEAITPSTEDSKAISSAFSARRIEDPTIRRDALFEQLTLSSFRANLKQRLQEEILRLDQVIEKLRAELTSLDQRGQRLLESMSALQDITQSREFLLDLVKNEQKKAESETEGTTKRLLKSVSERVAFSEAAIELARLSVISESLKDREEELIHNEAPTRARDLSQDIIRLRAEREMIGKSIADKLLDSHIILNQRFGGFDIRSENIRVGFELSALSASANVASGLVGAYSFDVKPEIDPRVWLPAMLPWPPPTPSSHIVLDRHLLDRRKPGLKTLGDLESALQFALASAGYSDASYWGVPRGFALVTPLEQTDSTGQPLAAHARWISKIVELKSFSLAEYIRALFTAPTGYFRVLVFIASPDAFAPSGSRELLETIERWSTGGLNFLPDLLRSEPFTDQHRVTVLVYEFLKLRDSEEPTTTVPGRLKVPDHLKATNLAFLVQ